MKKFIKLTLAGLLLTLMFSCEWMIIEDREIYINNHTGWPISYLYVIPADDYVDLSSYNNALNEMSYETEQLGSTYLYNGNSISVNLDNIDPFENYFLILAFDGSDMCYKLINSDTQSSTTLTSNDWYNFY